MVERERQPNPWARTEAVANELAGYLQNAEFGSAKFLAFQDYYERGELDFVWMDAVKEMTRIRRSNAVARAMAESGLRVLEMKRALLDTRISKRKAQIRGYGQAYATFADLFTELDNVGYDDALAQTAGNAEKAQVLKNSKAQAVEEHLKQQLEARSH